MLRFRAVFLLFLFSTILGVNTLPASAHTALVGTSPSDGQKLYAPVESLTLEFSETVELLPNAFKLFDSKGKVLPLKDPELTVFDNFTTISITLENKISEGWYAVGWKVVSKDGHPVSGAYSFTVDTNSDGDIGSKGSKELLTSIANPFGFLKPFVSFAKASWYASSVLVVGIIVFFLIGWKFREIYYRPLRNLLVYVLLYGILATIASWILDVYILYGNLSAITKLLSLPPGMAYLYRLIAYLGILVVLFMRFGKINKIKQFIFFGFSVLIIFSFSTSGHTTILQPLWLSKLALVSHLSVASIWIGGILCLCLILKLFRKSNPEEVAITTGRFSIAASISLAIMSVASSSLTIITLGNLSNLYKTDYGIALLVKLTFVVILATLGAYNHYILVPKILKKDTINFNDKIDSQSSELLESSSEVDGAVANLDTRRNLSLDSLFKVLRFEILFLVAIVFATAMMTANTAPRVAQYYGSSSEVGESYWAGLIPGHMHIPGMDMTNFYGRFDFSPEDGSITTSDILPERIVGSGKVQDYIFTLSLSANDKGPILKVVAVDSSGELVNFERLDLVFEHKVSGVGPLVRNASNFNDSWVLPADDLQIAGVWTITVKANIDNFTLVKGEIGITIA